MIPDEAIEAAARAIFERATFGTRTRDWDALERSHHIGQAREALEAALPTLLSHEREETRLAHLDAVVNAETVDRLEGELDSAKAEAWDEGRIAGQDCVRASNPYRSKP